MHDKLPVLLGRAILRLLRQTGMSPANISKRFYKQRIQFFFGSRVGAAKTGAKCQRPRCSQSESYSDHLSSSLPIFSSTIIHPILSKCYDAPAWAQAVNERERLFAGLSSLPALPALLLLAMSPQWFSGGLLVSRALHGVFSLFCKHLAVNKCALVNHTVTSAKGWMPEPNFKSSPEWMTWYKEYRDSRCCWPPLVRENPSQYIMEGSLEAKLPTIWTYPDIAAASCFLYVSVYVSFT